jgi:twitching motility protein PilT
VRAVLSFVLEGVITQNLIPRLNGQGRVLCAEVMIPNAAIRNLIREDKLHQVYSQMQIGQSKFGMQTMNQHLCELYMKKVIGLEDCLARSSELDELKQMILQAGGSLGSHAAPPNRGR